MKYFFMLLISCFIVPGFALAQQITNENPAGEERYDGDGEDERCFFDLTVVSRRVFRENNLASGWCNNIHQLFGFDRACFVRRHSDGRWVGDFRHQRRFYGNSYDGIFKGFTQWSDRHLFRGIRFDHYSSFSPSCFGRGGGSGYP